jgi:putative transposase
MTTNGIYNEFTCHHNRRSVRLQGYDYSRPGAYFVTICIEHRDKRLFGDIKNGAMCLNELGTIVRDEWLTTARMRPNVEIDEYVIMPNHIHGIIIIRDGRGPLQRAPTVHQQNEQFGKPTSNSIPTIVRLFKSATIKRINRLRNTPGHPVWQRNYYDHIIRDEQSLFQIRTYIKNNQLDWDSDEENPCGRSPRYVAMPDPQRAFMAV